MPSPGTSSPSPTARSEPVAADEIVIVGGGCYGTFYARQLERAQARGALTVRRVVVVDRDPSCQLTCDLPSASNRELAVRDWDEFFDEYLAQPSVPSPQSSVLSPQSSYIVPTPLMPHLMSDWLQRRARSLWPARLVAQEPLTEPLGTPYDVLAPDGTRYVSWADWLCPTHCIEPALCPIIRAPRTWEMAETVGAMVARLRSTREVAGPALFVTRHLTDGVGMFSLADAVAADQMLRDGGASGRPFAFVVGTVSACHGAVGLLGVT